MISLKLKMVSNLLMREINNNIAKKYKTIEEDSIVTGTTGKIIGFLYYNGDKEIFQKNIEEAFQIRRSTASKILKIMEQKGFICRESNNCDARMKRIILTEKSLVFHNIVNETINCVECKISKEIPEEELKIFLKVLDKIKSNIL